MTPANASPEIDLSTRIADIVRGYPRSERLLHEFGVDTCCGGTATLADASRGAGHDPADLLAALHELVRSK